MIANISKKFRLQDYFTDYGWRLYRGEYIDSWGTRSLSKSQIKEILRKMSKDATVTEISSIIVSMVGPVRAPIQPYATE